MDNNWIYFEHSKRCIHLSDFYAFIFVDDDKIFFDGEDGKNVVIHNKQDVEDFKRNILKMGDDK